MYLYYTIMNNARKDSCESKCKSVWSEPCFPFSGDILFFSMYWYEGFHSQMCMSVYILQVFFLYYNIKTSFTHIDLLCIRRSPYGYKWVKFKREIMLKTLFFIWIIKAKATTSWRNRIKMTQTRLEQKWKETKTASTYRNWLKQFWATECF